MITALADHPSLCVWIITIIQPQMSMDISFLQPGLFTQTSDSETFRLSRRNVCYYPSPVDEGLSGKVSLSLAVNPTVAHGGGFLVLPGNTNVNWGPRLINAVVEPHS